MLVSIAKYPPAKPAAAFMLLLSGIATMLLPSMARAADLSLDAPFSDHAVIQRGQPIDVHGTAGAGAQVEVTLGAVTRYSRADADGDWHAILPARNSGANLDLVASSGSKTVAAHGLEMGDVYLCSGQSNMEFPVSKTAWTPDQYHSPADADIRLLPIARQRSEVSLHRFEDSPAWVPAVGHSASFSAVCLFFGREVARKEKVPVGLIGSYWGATPIEAWLSRNGIAETGLMKPQLAMLDAFRANPAAARKRYGKRIARWWKPSSWKVPRLGYANLYNAMIAPLGDYGLSGALWYQGENNANAGNTTAQYRAKLAALLDSWRKQFKRPDLPFVIVQLAAFAPRPAPDRSAAWAQVREAQRLVAQDDPHAGLVVTIDVGERLDIHPPLKLPVGQRAFAQMQRLVYDDSTAPISPEAVSARRTGDQVLISLRDVTGKLQALSWGRPGPFQLCEGKTCRYADAHIAAGGISVAVPRGFPFDKVRYCWGGYPQCNVFDGKLLPLGPFVLPVADASGASR